MYQIGNKWWLRMVKPKWILHLCQKCFYNGLHMTPRMQGYQTFLGASQSLGGSFSYSWKCFYSGLHMTLECRDTRLWPVSGGCITMSLPWKAEPTKCFETALAVVHTLPNSARCAIRFWWLRFFTLPALGCDGGTCSPSGGTGSHAYGSAFSSFCQGVKLLIPQQIDPPTNPKLLEFRLKHPSYLLSSLLLWTVEVRV